MPTREILRIPNATVRSLAPFRDRQRMESACRQDWGQSLLVTHCHGTKFVESIVGLSAQKANVVDGNKVPMEFTLQDCHLWWQLFICQLSRTLSTRSRARACYHLWPQHWIRVSVPRSEMGLNTLNNEQLLLKTNCV